MHFTLVRHGETEENRKRIVQGQNPGTLSELGIKQSKEVAQKLSTRQFDVIYSSDLKRCKDTAKHIYKYHPDTPLIFAPELREINFGIFQGKLSVTVAWQDLLGSFITRKAPEGESLSELGQRVAAFLNSLYVKHPQQNLLIVTHGGPMRIIKSIFDGIPLQKLFEEIIPNCGVWDFTMTEPIDTDNLEKLLS